MELREILLIIHILGVLVVAGAFGAELLVRIGAGRSPDLATVERTASLEHTAGRIAAFSWVVVAAAGIWLVIESPAFEFSQAWLSAAFALWIVAMGIGGGILGRHASRVKSAAQAALARGESSSAEVQELWSAPIVTYGRIALGVSLVVFIYLMVAKPGL